MSQLKVQKADIKKTFDWGNVYTVIGELDGELETIEYASKKAPEVGETIEGTVETTQWGKKFKKASTGGGFRGGSAPRDPEVQRMIVRQNALSNAVQFLIAKSTLEKKPDELTTDNVILIATKFAGFSLGEVKAKPVVTDDDLHNFDDQSEFSEEGL